MIALCKQEQAEVAQERLAQAKHLKRSPSSADINSTKNAWRTAAGWWSTYLEGFGTARGAIAARRFKARAMQALGEKDAARALLLDFSGNEPAFDKLARLYLAKQLDAN